MTDKQQRQMEIALGNMEQLRMLLREIGKHSLAAKVDALIETIDADLEDYQPE